MANLKNITDVPVVESAEGLNLIVNDNGAAKQIPASAVGAQADWNVSDASNPAFIKNKPVIPEGFSGSWNDLTDKPFYEEEDITDIFIDKEFVYYADEPNGALFGSESGYLLEEGKVYNFIINGVTYSDIVFAGVMTEIADGYSCWNGSGYFLMYAPVGTTSLTVSLAVKNTTVKQIEEKFIPDSVKDRVFIMDMTVLTPDNFMDTTYGNTVKEALLNGKTVLVYDGICYFNVIAFKINETTTGEVYLRMFTHSSSTTGEVSSAHIQIPQLLITL